MKMSTFLPFCIVPELVINLMRNCNKNSEAPLYSARRGVSTFLCCDEQYEKIHAERYKGCLLTEHAVRALFINHISASELSSTRDLTGLVPIEKPAMTDNALNA